MSQPKPSQARIRPETLKLVLNRMLGRDIARVNYRTRELHGGTLGDVRLVTGCAETMDGGKLPYQVVLKRQEKWERPGDPDSWRREYDLFSSGLEKTFTGSLRWPACYHARMREDETELWLEYIRGISGSGLTTGMLEQAALEWGRWQGRLSVRQEGLRDIGCLGDAGFMEREFRLWHAQRFTYDFLVSEPCRLPGFLKQMLRDGKIQLIDGKSFEYGCLRSSGCGIPEHLKRMLMNMDVNKDEVFARLNNLPVLLCHRDLWLENIFYSDGNIVLIDWDTAGWGGAGEDIASLIADDTDAGHLTEYFRRLVPAYLTGLSEYMDVSAIGYRSVWEMIVIKFGYRFLQRYMFAESPEEKARQVEILQKIHELMEPQ